jgi:VIT1/CCC1 family predicted Fe2+/Mn2+ transporter
MAKNKHQSASQMLETRAAQVQRGAARAAVLGVNDGLVSVLCIVIGVAAAGADAKSVLLAGFAGMLAGGISMAAGEWISVKAQVELFENVLRDLKEIVKIDKHLLEKNLIKNFEAHGIDSRVAGQAVLEVASSEKEFVSMYSSQVIGLNEDELGSPWVAALSSFLLFTMGSLPPLVPWILGMNGEGGVLIAILLTGIASLFVGGYTAKTSGKSMTYGAVRQLLIVVFASVVTYGLGNAFGIAIS